MNPIYPPAFSREIAEFSPELGLILLEAFRSNQYTFIGTQGNGWEQDEVAWLQDTQGSWAGQIMPTHIVPRDLTVQGFTETLSHGGDTVLRLPSGTPLVLSFKSDSGGFSHEWFVSRTSAGIQSSLYGSSTSQENARLSGVTSTIPVGAVLDGSYVIGVRHQLGGTASKTVEDLPPDYEEVTGRKFPDFYHYTEGGVEKVYDPEYGIGHWPAHPNVAVFVDGRNVAALRADFLNSNKQKDRTEWTTFVWNSETQGTDYSLIKVQVGAGDFAIAGNYKLRQGAAAFRIAENLPFQHVTPQNSGDFEWAFDVMATALSCHKVLQVGANKGRVIFAGIRGTESGNNLAAWELLPNGTAKLLAQDPDPTDLACECALRNHSASDIAELADGTILVLGFCSCHVLDEKEPDIRKRFIPYPKFLDGMPGGRCLRIVDNLTYRFAEWFKVPSGGNERGITFYNRMMEVIGDKVRRGPGTVCHVHNCAEVFQGRLWGWRQDKATTAPGAQQFLSWYDGANWSDMTTLAFPASAFRWQRLVALNGGLFSTGYKPTDDTGVAGIIRGYEMRMLDFPYRVRRLTRTSAPGTNVACALCVGFRNAGIPRPLVVVEVNGYAETETPEPQSPPLPSGVQRHIYRYVVSGEGPLESIQIKDVTGDERLKTFATQYPAALRGRIDWTGADNNLASFDLQLEYSALQTLPYPAGTKLDLLVTTPAGQKHVPPVIIKR